MKQQKKRQDDGLTDDLAERVRRLARSAGGITGAARLLGMSYVATATLAAGVGCPKRATVLVAEVRLRELEAEDREGAK